MRRYDTYKDSGIQWIGQVPSHWEVKRLASLFEPNKSTNVDLLHTRAFQFYYGTLITKKREYKPEEDAVVYSKYTIISPNDIVINGLNLNYDFVSQRAAIAKEEGIITSAYLCIRPRKGVNPSFYCFQLKTLDAHKAFHGMGTGIRLTLSHDELKKCLLPVPPLSEQKAITNFLQVKTTKIEQYVSERERERAA